MKKALNFRLNHQAIILLTMLEEKLHTSKTAVIEESLEYYAKMKLKTKNPLMRYAGILSDGTADKMLVIIKKDRKNKKMVSL